MSYLPKTNWKYDDTPTEEDFNRIEQGIADAHNGLNQSSQGLTELSQAVLEIEEKRVAHQAERATTTGYGHTILNPTTNSNSHQEAATAGAVKAANDNANSRIPTSAINQPNGVLGLGPDGKPPIGSIPGSMVKITEVNLSLNPTLEIIVSNLSIYKRVMIRGTFKNAGSITCSLQYNDLTASGAYSIITITSSGTTSQNGAGITAVSATATNYLYIEIDADSPVLATRTQAYHRAVFAALNQDFHQDSLNKLRIFFNQIISEGSVEVWGEL